MHAVTGVPVVAGFSTNKSVLDLVCVLILLKVPVPLLIVNRKAVRMLASHH
jgi:hypothetical protein